jgi:hypothetical protein
MSTSSKISPLSKLFHRYLHVLLQKYNWINDDMKYMDHFQIISEYYARLRIDAIMASDTSFYEPELTLEEVHNYITTFWETDARGSEVDFTEFRKDFLSTYGPHL